MEGISKDRLIELLNGGCSPNFHRTLKWLIHNECRELNPWTPIENAPKDREIAVYCPPYADLQSFVSKCKWHDLAGFCVDELRHPTLYCELPENQKR